MRAGSRSSFLFVAAMTTTRLSCSNPSIYKYGTNNNKHYGNKPSAHTPTTVIIIVDHVQLHVRKLQGIKFNILEKNSDIIVQWNMI